MNKKGQSKGLVTGLVFGIAGLVIAVIITFVIISTLANSEALLPSTTNVALNETTGGINQSGYIVDNIATGVNPRSFTLTAVWNRLNDSGNYSVPLSQVSIDPTTGLVRNSTTLTFGSNTTVSYNWLTNTDQETSTSSLTGNFSSGVDNVSEQIPTILLIAAIILVLGILAVLVAVWQRMRLGNGSL